MPKINNKDKTPEIDESILEEESPNINEPQNPEEEIEEPEEKKKDTEPELPEEVEKTEILDKREKEDEDEKLEEQKEQRRKSQQTEAQILAARNRALMDKVDEASKLPDPTTEELKQYVAQDGIDWDDLSAFEQSMAKKSYLNEKRFSLVNESVQVTKKIDEWAKKVDEFLDTIDGKAEFVKLTGHEADFRKFAMQESHRGAALETLLVPAFIQNIPNQPQKRGSLFQTGGGGEAPDKPSKISVEDAAKIRATKGEKEYRRLIKSGQIDDSI